MDKYEFLDFVKRSQEKIEASAKYEKAFVKKLTIELFEFIFNYYPKYVPYRDKVTSKLKVLSNNCAKEIIENLGSALYYQRKNLPYKSKSGAKHPTTREESEKKLNELKKIVPKEEHEYLEEIHWEEFESSLRTEMFHVGLHNKAKEIMVDFFEEDILSLNGDCLRLLNDYTYLLSVYPFVDDVFSLLEPFIEKSTH